MSLVHFNLLHSTNLANMAPPTLPNGNFGNAQLPNGMDMPGMYIIVNTGTNNRYIGIANNIKNRFSHRLPTVVELGFDNATMSRIGVTWGSVEYQHTGVNAWHTAPANPATVMIDGVTVDLERLLIRFVLTQFGAGGTVSNNRQIAPYTNQTNNIVFVQLTWGNMGGLFTAGNQIAQWQPNQTW